MIYERDLLGPFLVTNEASLPITLCRVSQDAQERITQNWLLRIVDVSLSRLLALFHSLELATYVAL